MGRGVAGRAGRGRLVKPGGSGAPHFRSRAGWCPRQVCKSSWRRRLSPLLTAVRHQTATFPERGKGLGRGRMRGTGKGMGTGMGTGTRKGTGTGKHGAVLLLSCELRSVGSDWLVRRLENRISALPTHTHTHMHTHTHTVFAFPTHLALRAPFFREENVVKKCHPQVRPGD